MDNRRLRSILLNLQYRLTDNDRERLHFYLKNDVPRSCGDDSTLGGTLRLMQSLFDQDKISEKDFTLLIDAFKQIRCFDAVNRLKEHQRRLLLSGLNQSAQSLASMMPPLIEELINDFDDDDKCPTDTLLLKQINNTHNENNKNNIIDSNNININPININQNTRKQRYNKPSFPKKWFLFSLMLFILTLGILIAVSVIGMNRINTLENKLRVEQNFMGERQKENNQSMKQLNNRLVDQNVTIEELNKKLMESKKERKTILVKAGRKLGGEGGEDFDDSAISSFTSFHYVFGIIFSDIDSFGSCQFIYTSSDKNQSRIESKVHGNNGVKINSTYNYYLNNDDRVNRVVVRSINKTFLLTRAYESSLLTTKVINELQFVTTNNRRIPPGGELVGDNLDLEYFPGYTLGYVTGKSGLNIDQLQFFWYRT